MFKSLSKEKVNTIGKKKLKGFPSFLLNLPHTIILKLASITESAFLV